jgi:hypothetical protein
LAATEPPEVQHSALTTRMMPLSRATFPLGRSQLWIAISVYLLVAIDKERLDLPDSLYTLLQVLLVTISEQCPFHKHFSRRTTQTHSQLILIEF